MYGNPHQSGGYPPQLQPGQQPSGYVSPDLWPLHSNTESSSLVSLSINRIQVEVRSAIFHSVL